MKQLLNVRKADHATGDVSIYIEGRLPALSTHTDNAEEYEADATALYELLREQLPLGTWLVLRNLFTLGRIR